MHNMFFALAICYMFEYIHVSRCTRNTLIHTVYIIYVHLQMLDTRIYRSTKIDVFDVSFYYMLILFSFVFHYILFHILTW